MPAPDIAKFELAMIPGTSASVSLTVDFGGPSQASSTYTAPSDGVGSVSELLSLAAAKFTSDLSGTYTWSVDWSTQRAILDGSYGQSHLCVLSVTGDWQSYTGQGDVSVAQYMPITASAAPDGIWYPSRPLLADERQVVGRMQAAWHIADALALTAGSRELTRRTIRALVDNSAGDYAEYQQWLSFMLQAADFTPFSIFDDYASDYSSATLATMDERQTELRAEPLDPDAVRRYWSVTLYATERWTV